MTFLSLKTWIFSHLTSKELSYCIYSPQAEKEIGDVFIYEDKDTERTYKCTGIYHNSFWNIHYKWPDAKLVTYGNLQWQQTFTTNTQWQQTFTKNRNAD
jgi:hypothetical protein